MNETMPICAERNIRAPAYWWPGGCQTSTPFSKFWYLPPEVGVGFSSSTGTPSLPCGPPNVFSYASRISPRTTQADSPFSAA